MPILDMEHGNISARKSTHYLYCLKGADGTFYVGQSSSDNLTEKELHGRIRNHVKLAMIGSGHNGADELIRENGISGTQFCLYGDDPNNCFGVGMAAMEAFLAEGWTITGRTGIGQSEFKKNKDGSVKEIKYDRELQNIDYRVDFAEMAYIVKGALSNDRGKMRNKAMGGKHSFIWTPENNKDFNTVLRILYKGSKLPIPNSATLNGYFSFTSQDLYGTALDVEKILHPELNFFSQRFTEIMYDQIDEWMQSSDMQFFKDSDKSVNIGVDWRDFLRTIARRLMRAARLHFNPIIEEINAAQSSYVFTPLNEQNFIESNVERLAKAGGEFDKRIERSARLKNLRNAYLIKRNEAPEEINKYINDVIASFLTAKVDPKNKDDNAPRRISKDLINQVFSLHLTIDGLMVKKSPYKQSWLDLVQIPDISDAKDTVFREDIAEGLRLGRNYIMKNIVRTSALKEGLRLLKNFDKDKKVKHRTERTIAASQVLREKVAAANIHVIRGEDGSVYRNVGIDSLQSRFIHWFDKVNFRTRCSKTDFYNFLMEDYNIKNGKTLEPIDDIKSADNSVVYLKSSVSVGNYFYYYRRTSLYATVATPIEFRFRLL